MGLSQRQSVLIMYIASASLGLCAIVLADRGALSAIILLLAVAVFVIGGTKYMSDREPEDNGMTDEGTAANPALPENEIEKPTDGVTK